MLGNSLGKLMARLTKAKAMALRKPGLYSDGDTLYLRVAPPGKTKSVGSKQWIQRVTINGKRRDIGIGPFPLVSPLLARRKAFENRLAIFEGRDPLAEKRKAAMPRFRSAARSTHKGLCKQWRSKKVAALWMQRMERYAFPRLGDIRVDRIERADVLSVLLPIWSEKPATAKKVRQYIGATLKWCMANGFIDHNAAGEVIDGALPRISSVKGHFRALPYNEVAAALDTVEASKASQAAKLALRLLVLTATRTGEILGARWKELDPTRRMWTIPQDRTKTNKQYRVPLSDAALEVIERARALDDGSGLIFPSPAKPGSTMSNMTLTKVLRSTGLADRATVHGFRTSFRTWASERTDAEYAVMELSLGHAVGSAVEQAYARSDLLEKRRRLMDRWAAYLTGTEGKVVELHPGAAV